MKKEAIQLELMFLHFNKKIKCFVICIIFAILILYVYHYIQLYKVSKNDINFLENHFKISNINNDNVFYNISKSNNIKNLYHLDNIAKYPKEYIDILEAINKDEKRKIGFLMQYKDFRIGYISDKSGYFDLNLIMEIQQSNKKNISKINPIFEENGVVYGLQYNYISYYTNNLKHKNIWLEFYNKKIILILDKKNVDKNYSISNDLNNLINLINNCS